MTAYQMSPTGLATGPAPTGDEVERRVGSVPRDATRRTFTLGRDLKVGDEVVFLGHGHIVRSLEPYRHPHADVSSMRIARSDADWSITVLDDGPVEIRQ